MTDALSCLTSALADRYTIERELGRGGMAVVYLAEDVKHHRKVAVKVLRPELAAAVGAERFLNEIRVTANLQHPHILPLHDSGDADGFLYYVMPYVEGESLREKLNREKQLSVDEALKITRQVADALNSAHEQGVVHRDIKPENILLREGHALVADFGIALAVKTAGGERLTETGHSLGTPAYMSPEQVAGDREIDARSDIYSLACVLYEMLAGEPPFTGPNAQAVLARHMTDPVPPITTVRSSVPTPVATAITKALGKAPVDRFETAKAFSEALFADVAEAAPELKSIVVLPFENLSPDPDNEYFSDGLTEEIITDLSQLHTLLVISRNSAMQLKGTDKDTKTIGRDLNVQYVLGGSVRKAGDKLRVTAQLIDVRNDAHLWADKYTGSTEDVFDMQEKVSREIVAALDLTLTPEEHRKIAGRSIDNMLAYDCYLRARQEIWRWTPEALDRATRHLENGLQIIGDNALLLFGLGYVQFQCVNAGYKVGDEANDALRSAESYAEDIFRIRPDSSHGHCLLGLVEYKRGKSREVAHHFKAALTEDPRNLDALWFLAIVYARAGKVSLARPLVLILGEIDPLAPLSHAMEGYLYLMEGRFDQALLLYQRSFEMDPDDAFLRVLLADAHVLNGHTDAARELLDPMISLRPVNVVQWVGSLVGSALHRDHSHVARLASSEFSGAALEDSAYSHFVAQGYSLIDDRKNALFWLENAITKGMVNYPFLSRWDPSFEKLRGDPQFESLMQRVKDLSENFEA